MLKKCVLLTVTLGVLVSLFACKVTPTPTPTQKLKWSFQTGGYVKSSPAIAPDGTVYVGSYDDKFYALNPDGSLKWSFKTGHWVRSSPAIASDGTVYFGSDDGRLYALKPDGSLKWSFKTGDWVDSSPAIASDGTVYVGSDDHKLYAFKEDNGGLADSPWPMFHHDPQHTGRGGVRVGVCPCPTGLRVPEDYSTIAAAIKAAQPGDCINVGPGTYREELWIDKDIILCGAGVDVTIIEGKITIASGAIHIIHIEGFRIVGPQSGIVVNHYTRPKIWHNIVEHNDYGILIWSLSEPEISYNVIRYNQGCGVSIDVPERTTVTGTGNEIYGNGQDLCPSEDAFPPGFRK